MKALIKSFLNKPLTEAEHDELDATIDACGFGSMASLFVWPIFYCIGEVAGKALATCIFA